MIRRSQRSDLSFGIKIDKAFVRFPNDKFDRENVLIISDSFDDKTHKSARNVKPVKLATAADVNTEQLLAFQKILVTSKALEKVSGENPMREPHEIIETASLTEKSTLMSEKQEQICFSRQSAREQDSNQRRG